MNKLQRRFWQHQRKYFEIQFENTNDISIDSAQSNIGVYKFALHIIVASSFSKEPHWHQHLVTCVTVPIPLLLPFAINSNCVKSSKRHPEHRALHFKVIVGIKTVQKRNFSMNILQFSSLRIRALSILDKSLTMKSIVRSQFKLPFTFELRFLWTNT